MRKIFILLGILFMFLIDFSSCKTKDKLETTKTELTKEVKQEKQEETETEIYFSVEYPHVDSASSFFNFLALDDESNKKPELNLPKGTKITYNVIRRTQTKEKKKENENNNIENEEKQVNKTFSCQYVVFVFIFSILLCLCVRFRKKIKKMFGSSK